MSSNNHLKVADYDKTKSWPKENTPLILPSTTAKSDSSLNDSCSSRKGSFSSNASVQAEGSGSGCVTSKSGVPPGIPEKATLAAVRVGDLRLVLVNFVVAGLEVAASVAFTFIPPLLLKSGYSETEMSIIFGIGNYLIKYLIKTLIITKFQLP